jgi:hypothetical protein
VTIGEPRSRWRRGGPASLSVTSLTDARGAISNLEDDGWLHWPTDPNRSWRYDHPHVRELRTFRDALCANDALRDRYEALKRNLAKAFRDDREAYAKAETAFIHNGLRQSGIEPHRRPGSD